MGGWMQELPGRCEEEGLRGKVPRLQKEMTHRLTMGQTI